MPLPTDFNRSQVMTDLLDAAKKAGTVIMDVYAEDFDVEYKDDKSPVTEADKRADEVILPLLASAAPAIPVISEESFSHGTTAPQDKTFFLVDPIDGTKEFINRNGEFTVNIALIVDGHPELGVVYAPAINRLFWAEKPGCAYEQKWHFRDGALEEPVALETRPQPADGLTVVGSRSHGSEETATFLKQFNVRNFVSAGSSLKFCLLAAGEADLYPRHGPTMEWDTGAGHAVLRGAGGSVTTLDGGPFEYGKADFRNGYFLARS